MGIFKKLVRFFCCGESGVKVARSVAVHEAAHEGARSEGAPAAVVQSAEKSTPTVVPAPVAQNVEKSTPAVVPARVAAMCASSAANDAAVKQFVVATRVARAFNATAFAPMFDTCKETRSESLEHQQAKIVIRDLLLAGGAIDFANACRHHGVDERFCFKLPLGCGAVCEKRHKQRSYDVAVVDASAKPVFAVEVVVTHLTDLVANERSGATPLIELSAVEVLEKLDAAKKTGVLDVENMAYRCNSCLTECNGEHVGADLGVFVGGKWRREQPYNRRTQAAKTRAIEILELHQVCPRCKHPNAPKYARFLCPACHAEM